MIHFAGTMVSVLKISPVNETLKPVAAAAGCATGGKPNSHIKS